MTASNSYDAEVMHDPLNGCWWPCTVPGCPVVASDGATGDTAHGQDHWWLFGAWRTYRVEARHGV